MNITVIIPIHKINENEKDYFAKAISSIDKQKLLPKEILLVIPKDENLRKTIESYEYGGNIKDLVNIVENNGETDFCSQINFGVSKVKTELFSVLEMDDEYSIIWFDNVIRYIGHYKDVDAFLPIVLDTNTEGNFLHFTNEAVWAKDFSDTLGMLDNDSLLNFPNFQLSGGVYNKETFESVGGLKPSIKLQFNYEFFLRMTYYDKKIMTIPKLGYRKTNMRPNSLFYDYYHNETKKMLPDEARFWFNTAKKECYFKQDRGIKYEENEIS